MVKYHKFKYKDVLDRMTPKDIMYFEYIGAEIQKMLNEEQKEESNDMKSSISRGY